MHPGILILGLACVIAALVARVLAEFVAPIPARANSACATVALVGGLLLIVSIYAPHT